MTAPEMNSLPTQLPNYRLIGLSLVKTTLFSTTKAIAIPKCNPLI